MHRSKLKSCRRITSASAGQRIIIAAIEWLREDYYLSCNVAKSLNPRVFDLYLVPSAFSASLFEAALAKPQGYDPMQVAPILTGFLTKVGKKMGNDSTLKQSNRCFVSSIFQLHAFLEPKRGYSFHLHTSPKHLYSGSSLRMLSV